MSISANKILITGAAGWLGRGLLNALINGLPDCERLCTPHDDLNIRVFVPAAEEEKIRVFSKNLEIIAGNLTNPEDCQLFCDGFENAILFHLAGVIHPKRSVKEFYAVNVQGIKNMLQSAEKAGIKRAVIMSSNSPIGCNPKSDHLFDEQSPYNPYMNYGRSKMLKE